MTDEQIKFCREIAVQFYAEGWDKFFIGEALDKRAPFSEQQGWKAAQKHV